MRRGRFPIIRVDSIQPVFIGRPEMIRSVADRGGGFGPSDRLIGLDIPLPRDCASARQSEAKALLAFAQRVFRLLAGDEG